MMTSMPPTLALQLAEDLLLVVVAGLVSGAICKRLGISLVVGYLVVGAAIGVGGLGLFSEESHALGRMADVGAMLLLFSIGIEFSLEDLARLGRAFLLGGTVQMTLVALPAAGVAVLAGIAWPAAVLIGAAAALSSTVLVYKALEEWGHASAPHGRRAIGVLLFQDVAAVPLMLFVPLLAGAPETAGRNWGLLVLHTVLFVSLVPIFRAAVARWIAPYLAGLRSIELLVLFTLGLLAAAALGAYAIGLPPALGAFAAGLILNGNRLSAQIEAVVLPFRETFAAVFFVSLGSMMRFDTVASQPLLSLAMLAAMLALKTAAAAIALRLTGLEWRAAAGMGLGLAQLGEFSFLLLSEGQRAGVISAAQYDAMLFIALGTLVATPQLLKTGLRWSSGEPAAPEPEPQGLLARQSEFGRALVIGLGPIGAQVTSRLEIAGMDVCLLDLSPVNLHPFAQQGFRTLPGDATDPDLLHRAQAERCRIAVVTVPDDAAAIQIVSALRGLNSECTIVVRCRYRVNMAHVRRAGANAVVNEESLVSESLLQLLDPVAGRSAKRLAGSLALGSSRRRSPRKSRSQNLDGTAVNAGAVRIE